MTRSTQGDEAPRDRDRTEERCEIYETDSGQIIAFLGTFGNRGVWVYRPNDAETPWQQHPVGSLVWDSLHQSVYRNHRALGLVPEDLRIRGISLPTLDESQSPAKAMDWANNFDSEAAYAEVPDEILSRLRKQANAWKKCYLILIEDTYETCFGDGKFLYVDAAFWDKPAAKNALEVRQGQEEAKALDMEKKGFGYCGQAYNLKEIRLKVDEGKKRVVGDFDIQAYEHISMKAVMNHLRNEGGSDR